MNSAILMNNPDDDKFTRTVAITSTPSIMTWLSVFMLISASILCSIFSMVDPLYMDVARLFLATIFGSENDVFATNHGAIKTLRTQFIHHFGSFELRFFGQQTSIILYIIYST